MGYVNEVESVLIRRILNALDGLEYGSVNITIHDSQITQIDRIERQRFPLTPSRKVSIAGKQKSTGL